MTISLVQAESMVDIYDRPQDRLVINFERIFYHKRVRVGPAKKRLRKGAHQCHGDHAECDHVNVHVLVDVPLKHVLFVGVRLPIVFLHLRYHSLQNHSFLIAQTIDQLNSNIIDRKQYSEILFIFFLLSILSFCTLLCLAAAGSPAVYLSARY